MDKIWNEFRANLNLVAHNNRVGSHVGCLRVNANNTLEHELTKFLVFFQLKRHGHDLLTEPIFKTAKQGRPDIFDLTTSECIEVVKSESNDSLTAKALRYPRELNIYTVPAIQLDQDTLCLLSKAAENLTRIRDAEL